jgi:ATP-binding cassette subfamily B protein
LFITQAERYKDKNLELAKVDATFFPLMVFLTGCSTLIAVAGGGYYVLNGEITIGNIAEFVIYVNLLTWPVASLGWTSSLVQRAAASQQRLNEFLQEKPEITETAESSFHFDQHIEFKGVSFTYPGKEIPALKNINITIEKGRTLAVLGTTGSGKSTFIQLLLRMMDCTQGDILIDGKSIRKIDLKAYKNKIGYVPQEVFLFSDTIKNNIAFGVDLNSPQNIEEEVFKAAKAAALHENVTQFTHGYETILGERGITLSGGQKQRLSIARALVKSPEILILDDCLSAVDTHTEAEILQNLRPIMQDKTSFIVSHRVSTVKDADFIIVLHEGEIVESGNHPQLLQKQGIYYTLYNKQLLEEMA